MGNSVDETIPVGPERRSHATAMARGAAVLISNGYGVYSDLAL